ncbi:hypothetical protein GYMLUDRAFT_241893 [Collybiopsis luxurians FD-317 M1]|uniref:Unplaced genomic scaffold GYMLUscaffold_16, whole genome shotgun sequence n=1 Tax=Collybiopsis luxurians FD-317 M1 TaxID=944289 RepID=A0A0D0BHE6_9AGAR|nr:hypothetical protein GYMLUDRAFT_241893 [Collybiopsis luxurians FD-317 M1]
MKKRAAAGDRELHQSTDKVPPEPHSDIAFLRSEINAASFSSRSLPYVPTLDHGDLFPNNRLSKSNLLSVSCGDGQSSTSALPMYSSVESRLKFSSTADRNFQPNTSLRGTSIRDHQMSRAYCTAPPIVPNVDLLSDVVGRQVHNTAATITWPCGWRTIVPTGMENGINVLEPDAERVRWMADPRNAVPRERSNVKYLHKAAYKKNNGALIDDIRKLNAQNYVVVVSGGVDDHGKKFECYEDIKTEYSLGINKSLDLQYHNLIKWAKHEPTGYHTAMTVLSFVDNVNNPDVVGMILDIPVCKQAIPEPYNLVDDSAKAFHQTRSNKNLKTVGLNVTFHMDSLFAPTWALLHHAGAFTNVHQDAEGFSVAGQVLGDRDNPQPKMWGIMSFKDPSVAAQSHEKIAQRISELCEYRNLAQENDQTGGCWDDEIWKECEVDIVYLQPGDIFFQPPGALHLVYTPTACVASGGHFYSYDSMHLTEWTRRIQHYKSDTITNQSPLCVKELLNLMMIDFPSKDGQAAFCKMVLADEQYVFQGRQRKRLQNKLDRRAEDIAFVVARCCLDVEPECDDEDIVGALDDILKNGDYQDPGKPFTLGTEVYAAVEELAINVWDVYKKNGKKSSSK